MALCIDVNEKRIEKPAINVKVGDIMLVMTKNFQKMSALTVKQIVTNRIEKSQMIELHTSTQKVIVSDVLASCSSNEDNMFLKKYVEPSLAIFCP